MLSRIFAIAVLLGVIVLAGVGVGTLNQSEQLPTQTSPDGQWKVEVYGKRLWNGSVEVSARVISPEGTTSRSVKGMASSFDDFRAKFGSLQFRGNEAFADGQPFVGRPAAR